MKSLLHSLPGAAWLRGGWPDEARVIVQRQALLVVLRDESLSGPCLNAGAGEGLYAGFLESFSAITSIVHMDIGVGPALRLRSDPRHQACAGSVTAIPFATGTFGAALCTEVMEHVQDDRQGFAELGRVVRRGGLLVLSVPTPPAPPDPAHVREGYTLDELTGHLNQAGFVVVRTRTCFHATLRALMAVWRWQFRVAGRSRRSLMPRLVMVLAAHIDRRVRWGRPWDLVVLARRE